MTSFLDLRGNCSLPDNICLKLYRNYVWTPMDLCYCTQKDLYRLYSVGDKAFGSISKFLEENKLTLSGTTIHAMNLLNVGDVVVSRIKPTAGTIYRVEQVCVDANQHRLPYYCVKGIGSNDLSSHSYSFSSIRAV